ncbi:hypothetical protein BDZ89DRAFT_1064224 [Hymenopellis radicata]|nr:hypothetical protein BDZ89DRAFT_1064224 [Hymenopellis radicata]
MSRKPFITVRLGLLRCGIDPDMPMRLPPSNVDFADASRLSGVVWIDKTTATDDMDLLGAPLSLIRRPSGVGFGKTCFPMMNLSPKLSDLVEVSDGPVKNFKAALRPQRRR